MNPWGELRKRTGWNVAVDLTLEQWGELVLVVNEIQSDMEFELKDQKFQISHETPLPKAPKVKSRIKKQAKKEVWS